MHIAVYARAARFYRYADRHLFDIPEVKLNYLKEVLAKKHLLLNTFRDGCTEMTGFLVGKLHRIYSEFGIQLDCL